jgi:hypothetical protein
MQPANIGTHENRAGCQADALAVGQLERLPKWLNLVPMVGQWLWLSIRYGSATLPSSANPALTSGGMVGEGKLEYFDIMGEHARAMTAATTCVRNTGVTGLDAAKNALQAAGITYPIIAKPDIGWCGFGVRLVRNDAELLEYLGMFPLGETIVLQRFIPYEGEAGLFYMRDPDQFSGRVIGILLRYFPRVVGNGVDPVASLIARDARLTRLGRDGLSEPCCDPAYIPGAGEIVRVATIGSTRVGGLYRDATPLITPALNAAVDALARDMTAFYAGRFDVRYESLNDLLAGQNFTIIEVNGAGSEAVHAWDPQFSLRKAYGIIFEKQRLLFSIAAKMRRRGHKPITILQLAKLFLQQHRLIRRYPPSN